MQWLRVSSVLTTGSLPGIANLILASLLQHFSVNWRIAFKLSATAANDVAYSLIKIYPLPLNRLARLDLPRGRNFCLDTNFFTPSELGPVDSLTTVGVSINVSYVVTSCQIHKPN